MIKYIFKRLCLVFLTLFMIVSITFLGMSLMPGNPYPNAEKMTQQQIEQLDKQYGFDRSIGAQYVDYMSDVFLGEDFPQKTELFALDFGSSFQNNQPVKKDILRRYPISFRIGVIAVIVGSMIGIVLGLIASLKKNSFGDYFATFIAVLGVSFPAFVIASYLQYYVAVEFNLLPSLFIKGDITSYILPIVSLSFFAIASIARVTRTEMVELNHSNFVNLARAKGVKNRGVIFNHSFRNALISVLTVLGPLTIALTTGSLVVEKIFSVPGLGGLLTTAVITKDIFVVCGATFFIALQILIMYLIVDILYVLVDPRIKLQGGK